MRTSDTANSAQRHEHTARTTHKPRMHMANKQGWWGTSERERHLVA